MLRVRLIPVLLLRDERMVKPIQFGAKGERDVGFPVTTAKIYDSQDADELIFLDITASGESREFLCETLKKVTENCFVPITAGGGVKSLEDFEAILGSGADKVSINTFALEIPQLITKASDKYGSQCVVVSIDVKKNKDGLYEVFTDRGKKSSGIEVLSWAKKVVNLGAGEILLTSVDKEGTMTGYDLELIKMVAEAVPIPVIAHGGAGSRQHFVDAIRTGEASAVAAGSVFHFSNSNLNEVKSFMYNAGLPMRPNY